jgi:hypothetical protein
LQIVQNEGLLTFLNGMQQNLISSTISIVSYLYFYEKAKITVNEFTQHPVWHPILSATTARFLATNLIFPMDYWKTIKQSQTGYTSVSGYKLGNKIWKGYFALLKRDISFAALLWLFTENIRNYLRFIHSKVSSSFKHHFIVN